MINIGREWDWIQELYYKELNDRSKNNRDSRKVISGEKKIPRKQNQLKHKRQCNNS